MILCFYDSLPSLSLLSPCSLTKTEQKSGPWGSSASSHISQVYLPCAYCGCSPPIVGNCRVLIPCRHLSLARYLWVSPLWEIFHFVGSSHWPTHGKTVLGDPPGSPGCSTLHSLRTSSACHMCPGNEAQWPYTICIIMGHLWMTSQSIPWSPVAANINMIFCLPNPTINNPRVGVHPFGWNSLSLLLIPSLEEEPSLQALHWRDPI